MRRLLVGLIGVCLSTWSQAADWPQFRGPDLNGLARVSSLNTDWQAHPPKELWRVAISDSGYAAPAVVAGRAYVLDHQGNEDVIRALGVADGKEIWTFRYADSASPVGGYGFTRPTPTVANGRLYTISATGKIHCLDAETGKLIWKRELSEFKGHRPNWGYAASPLLHDGKLIVCPGGSPASIAALDPQTGKTLWTSGTDGSAYSTPVPATLNGVPQYLVFSQTSLNGYAMKDGKRLWTFPWKTSYDVNASSPIVVGENAVFLSSGYNVGAAVLEIGTAGVAPRVRWKDPVIQQHFNSAVLFGGHLYSTTDPGDLVCVDAQTGKALWRHGGFEKGGIVGLVGEAATPGALMALTGNGGELVLVAMSPEKYAELGRIKPLSGQCWTAPVVADGKVFVRSQKELVCLSIN